MRQLLPELRELTDDDLLDLYDVPGPHLRAGFVASADGAVSVDGRSGGLSSPADKAVFRALRGVCDAVLVGAGTLRAEGYGPVVLQPAAAAWRVAHGREARVPVVVVSRTGDLGDGRVLQGPVLLAAPEGVRARSAQREHPEVERLPADPVALVAALHARGLTRLLCEGGPSLLTALLADDLVDEVCLTTSPQLVGPGPRVVGGLATPRHLRLAALLHDDPGVLLGRWSVVRSRGD